MTLKIYHPGKHLDSVSLPLTTPLFGLMMIISILKNLLDSVHLHRPPPHVLLPLSLILLLLLLIHLHHLNLIFIGLHHLVHLHFLMLFISFQYSVSLNKSYPLFFTFMNLFFLLCRTLFSLVLRPPDEYIP